MRQLRNAGNLESILSSGESAKFDFIQANENTWSNHVGCTKANDVKVIRFKSRGTDDRI